MRGVFSRALTAVACILAIAGVAVFWMDTTLLDSRGYGRVVAPLWKQPAVRAVAARQIAQHITKNADLESTAEMWFPGTAQSQPGLVVRQVRRVLPVAARGIAEEYASSPEFEAAWLDVNLTVHSAIAHQLLSPGNEAQRVTADVDLSEYAAQAAKHAPQVAMSHGPSVQSDKAVPLLERHEFGVVRSLISGLHGRAGVLLLAAVALAAMASLALGDALRSVRALSLGLLVGSVCASGFAWFCRSYLLYRMSDWHLTPSFTAAMYQAVATPLYVYFACTMVLALVAWTSVWALDRSRGRGPDAGIPPRRHLG